MTIMVMYCRTCGFILPTDSFLAFDDSHEVVVKEVAQLALINPAMAATFSPARFPSAMKERISGGLMNSGSLG